jgi:hybrid polyketide synthase / nonribosomal peptide synthetase ACE1
VFFGNDPVTRNHVNRHPLYVGSIKTVLGHAEGAAGLAGVLKASLALQNRVVPPNLLLDKLSPKIKPFYTNLKILSEAIEWPTNTSDGIRRASVNSFGFGGANSHAILENFVPSSAKTNISRKKINRSSILNTILPFNFSSGSTRSLREHLAASSSYLKALPSNELRNYAWTMNSRRSTLPARISMYASTKEELIVKLDEIKQTLSGVVTVQDQPLRNPESPRLLGIFTGQGAQWAKSKCFCIVITDT